MFAAVLWLAEILMLIWGFFHVVEQRYELSRENQTLKDELFWARHRTGS